MRIKKKFGIILRTGTERELKYTANQNRNKNRNFRMKITAL